MLSLRFTRLFLTVVLFSATTLTIAQSDYTTITENGQWEPQFLESDDGIEMAVVPPGCFEMGSRGVTALDETPQEKYCFYGAFLIDRYEITNALHESSGYFTNPEQPRDSIDWFEARDFCQRRTFGDRPLRLPTEAEWEYTARGPSNFIYPWGDTPSRNVAIIDDYFDSRAERTTLDVGSVPGGDTWVGASDMVGNVWEWTSTLYDTERFPYPYNPNDGRENLEDTQGLRVLRGSSAFNTSDSIYAANRFARVPETAFSLIGFRCAISLETSVASSQDPNELYSRQLGDPPWQPQLTTQEGVEMVVVPSGCFYMGSDAGDADEKPVELTCIENNFLLDRYEVTNAVYGSSGELDEPNQPRETVSWEEAAKFCESRDARLPTEAEWEYAARGVENLTYPWGNDFEKDYLVWAGTSSGQTHNVGAFSEDMSWVGAQDMAGNVSEWTSSIYDRKNFLYPYVADDGREDESISRRRVVRGGNFSSSQLPRAADRDGRFEQIDRREFIGFRCAKDQ